MLVKVFSRSIAMLGLIGLMAFSSQATPLPRSGTVLKMINGDLMCYIELRDSQGKIHQLGAVFELCERPKKFLNKKVGLTYKKLSVSDCQSAEPCGKTRKEMLAVKLKLIR
jgi:hypothetical protein